MASRELSSSCGRLKSSGLPKESRVAAALVALHCGHRLVAKKNGGRRSVTASIVRSWPSIASNDTKGENQCFSISWLLARGCYGCIGCTQKISERNQEAPTQSAVPDRLYYHLTLVRKPSGGFQWSIQTEWCGYTEERPRREIRWKSSQTDISEGSWSLTFAGATRADSDSLASVLSIAAEYNMRPLRTCACVCLPAIVGDA
jgi:hypothetical protein